MLIKNNAKDLFKPILCTINKDIEVDDSFVPIDNHLFIHTEKYEGSERGQFEICVLKSGSQVWATLMPNGDYYISDSENSHVCHASCSKKDLMMSQGNKQHKEIVKYLKSIGCGKEIIEKEVKFPFKVNLKELSDNLFSWILLISIITFLFNCFKLEYLLICSAIVFCFSLNSMIKRYFRVKKKFVEVKEYFLSV